MEIIQQLVNGLDKGTAYALIALGLSLIFGTLGVVNFAHGALFMIGMFIAVSFQNLFNMGIEHPTLVVKDFLGNEKPAVVPFAEYLFGPEMGAWVINNNLWISLVMAVPLMALFGTFLDRVFIRLFYRRPHVQQILLTFGIAIVLQELIKVWFGGNTIEVVAPAYMKGITDLGTWVGFDPGTLVYPTRRVVFVIFGLIVLAATFSFIQFTRFGMVVRAGMQDREMVDLLGINIQRRFTIIFALGAVIAGTAGVMYSTIEKPVYFIGMDYMVLSFIVVVVGGMGSLTGAVISGFLLGILVSLSALWAQGTGFFGFKFFFDFVAGVMPSGLLNVFQKVDQLIVYVVAISVLLLRPRGLMGRKGIMED